MRRILPILLIALLALGLLAGLTWTNYQFARQFPGGIDFMTHWVAARHALAGDSPYSPGSAEEIQRMFYGRPAVRGENEFLVLYPLYYIVFLLPFGMVRDYVLARSLWMTFAELLLALTAIFSARAAGWKLKALSLPFYLLFALFWYHGLRTVVNGNLVVLVAFWLSVAALAVRERRDWLAGLALVFATTKPNIVLLPVLWALVWAVRSRRWGLVWGLVGGAVGLTLLGMVFFPAWPFEMLGLMSRYPSYNPPTNPGMVLALWWPAGGRWLGLALSLAIAVLLAREYFLQPAGGEKRFVWLLALSITLNQWIGITTDPGNFVVMFLPLALVLAALDVRAGSGWMLAALAILFAGLWAFFLLTYEVDAMNQPLQSPALFFPLPLVLLAGLYFFRKHLLEGDHAQPASQSV
jgi:hypothetical protein